MKDARELLQKLRAAGVEPMSDEELRESAGLAEIEVGEHRSRAVLYRIRVIADLLEARAKLAEVREWAAAHASEPADSGVLAVGRLCGKEVFEILDREPGS